MDVGVVGLEFYKLLFPQILNTVDCPVELCPAKANNPNKAKGTLYVSSLKIERGHLAGGTVTVTAV